MVGEFWWIHSLAKLPNQLHFSVRSAVVKSLEPNGSLTTLCHFIHSPCNTKQLGNQHHIFTSGSCLSTQHRPSLVSELDKGHWIKETERWNQSPQHARIYCPHVRHNRKPKRMGKRNPPVQPKPYDWSTYPPSVPPPPQQGFYKALLRETNG